MSKAKNTKAGAKHPAKKAVKQAPVKSAEPREMAARHTNVKVVRFDRKPEGKDKIMQTENMERATQTMMQAYEELNSMARAFSEATMQSAAAMSKGWEEITRNASGMMQESMENSVNAGKTLMSAKSLQEAMATQQEMTKDFFDRWMAGAGKLTEISARVSKEVAEPVAQQVNTTMSKMMSKGRMAA